MCNTFEINIGLFPIRNYGKKGDVDHCPQSPRIGHDVKYNSGLVKGHYFMNDYTELTPYSLYNYEETKDIKDCSKM